MGDGRGKGEMGVGDGGLRLCFGGGVEVCEGWIVRGWSGSGMECGLEWRGGEGMEREERGNAWPIAREEGMGLGL